MIFFQERGRVLHMFSDLMEEHSEDLASLETLDNGKPLDTSRHMDLPFSIKFVRSIAGKDKVVSGVLSIISSC